MNDKITQNMTYTEMRSKLYAEHTHHKNDSAFKPEAKLRFDTVKGLRTRRWPVLFRKTKTKMQERQQAISVVKNAINKEFGVQKIDGQLVGDFIMEKLGKGAVDSHLTVNDLKKVDGLLMESNLKVGRQNYHNDGGSSLRIATNAKEMFQSAINDPYSRASDDLKHWKVRSVGAERILSAVMKDLKELDFKTYGSRSEDALRDAASTVMTDAGIDRRRGINSANIARLKNFMMRKYGETGSGLADLSNTMLMKSTADHAKISMNIYTRSLKDDIQSSDIPTDLKDILSVIHSDANRLKSKLTLLNKFSHAPGSDHTADLHSGYCDLANNAQSLRNSLPKDEQDGKEKALQRYKRRNPVARGSQSFDALPRDEQVSAMKRIDAELNTAKNLESLANESHNLALALLPPQARVPRGHRSFFSANSLRNPTDLGNAKAGDIGQKVVLPKDIYQKVTNVDKKRSLSQWFFDKMRTPNPNDIVNQAAITERNLTNITKLYNGMVERTQKSLDEYQKDPQSMEKLEAFMEDAEYTSILGNRLMSKTKTLAGRGKREPASFLQKLHSFFRPDKYLQNGKIRFNNKNQLAADLQPTMRSLGEQRESLNNLRRMAAIEYDRLKLKVLDIDARVPLQDPITEQDKHLSEVLVTMKPPFGVDNVEMPPKNDELSEEEAFDTDSEVSRLPAKDSEPKKPQPKPPISREPAPFKTAQPLLADDLEPKEPPQSSVPRREIHDDAAVKNVADEPVAENPEPSEAKKRPAKLKEYWVDVSGDEPQVHDKKPEFSPPNKPDNAPIDNSANINESAEIEDIQDVAEKPEPSEVKKKPAKLKEYWVDVSGDEPQVHDKKPEFSPPSKPDNTQVDNSAKVHESAKIEKIQDKDLKPKSPIQILAETAQRLKDKGMFAPGRYGYNTYEYQENAKAKYFIEETWVEYYNKTHDDKIESFPISEVKDNENLYNAVWALRRDVDDLSKLKPNPQGLQQGAALYETLKHGNVLALETSLERVLTRLEKAINSLLNDRSVEEITGDDALQYDMLVDFALEFNKLYENIRGAEAEFKGYNRLR